MSLPARYATTSGALVLVAVSLGSGSGTEAPLDVDGDLLRVLNMNKV